jgi:hypothetical protein
VGAFVPILQFTFNRMGSRLIVTGVGTVRGLLDISYLSRSVLVPFLIATFGLAALVRLAAFYVERVNFAPAVYSTESHVVGGSL